MTRVYTQRGNCFYPTSTEAMAVVPDLPPGTYQVAEGMTGFYLERIADFALPEKLYGEVLGQARRIVGTFLSRPAGTGALLSGVKGAGKTLLTKVISHVARVEHGVPTIIVGEAFCGEDFNALIGGMGKMVVMFDEFEKVYDAERQEQLLTLFDGLYSSQKLFLLTCNNRGAINENMDNRPGRMFYSLDFSGLSRAFVEEYCQDKLDNKDHARGVLSVSAFFSQFSFDMLQALVEEMNRYGETASQAMQMLNMRPQNEDHGSFELTGLRNGKPLLCDGQSNDRVNRNPLSLNGYQFSFYGFDAGKVPEGGLSESLTVALDVSNLQSVDIEEGRFVFGTNEPDVSLQLERRRFRTVAVNYDGLPE